jgi:hypothetical protein
MKNILLILILSIIFLTLVACGGGGSGGGNSTGQNQQTTKTTAKLTIDLTGTLTASSAISGAAFTLTLPADVTPAITNGGIASGVVASSGTFVGSTLSPQVIYTPVTAGAPGTLKVTLANSIPNGVTQIGEVATITLQLSNGATPTVSSFGLSSVNVIDAALYAPITGMNAIVKNVALQ